MKTKDPFRVFFNKIIHAKPDIIQKNSKIKSNFHITINETQEESDFDEERLPIDFPEMHIKNLKDSTQSHTDESKKFENNQENFIEDIFQDLIKDFKEKNKIIFCQNEKLVDFSTETSFEMISDSLWQIESVDIYKGGIMQWDQLYRFKHFSTGKYLSISSTNGVLDVLKILILKKYLFISSHNISSFWIMMSI